MILQLTLRLTRGSSVIMVDLNARHKMWDPHPSHNGLFLAARLYTPRLIFIQTDEPAVISGEEESGVDLVLHRNMASAPPARVLQRFLTFPHHHPVRAVVHHSSPKTIDLSPFLCPVTRNAEKGRHTSTQHRSLVLQAPFGKPPPHKTLNHGPHSQRSHTTVAYRLSEVPARSVSPNLDAGTERDGQKMHRTPSIEDHRRSAFGGGAGRTCSVHHFAHVVH